MGSFNNYIITTSTLVMVIFGKNVRNLFFEIFSNISIS